MTKKVTTIVATNKRGLEYMMSINIYKFEIQVGGNLINLIYLHKPIDSEKSPGRYPSRKVLNEPFLLWCPCYMHMGSFSK